MFDRIEDAVRRAVADTFDPSHPRACRACAARARTGTDRPDRDRA